uniref:hypothetical protein n=1 Tax=Xanthomonas melonis TaxID=56456 RepID=UPI003EBD7647
ADRQHPTGRGRSQLLFQIQATQRVRHVGVTQTKESPGKPGRFKYDSDTQMVRWAHTRHKRAVRRWLNHRWSLVRYFLLASMAMGAIYVAAHASGLLQWLYATAAALCGIGAFISLWRCDAEKKAADAGEIWIKRINDSLKSPDDTNDLIPCETFSMPR